MVLLPLLSYAYELQYDQEPDYHKIKFLFKKILMDNHMSVEVNFDWNLRAGEEFKMQDPDDDHSSISSCDILSQESDSVPNLRHNMNKFLIDFKVNTNASQH